MTEEMQEMMLQEAEKCAAHLAACLKMQVASMSNTYEWTPVSVALPPKSGRYMVTIKNKGKRRTEMRNFDYESQKWESERWVTDNIIAWQERPAPYKE